MSMGSVRFAGGGGLTPPHWLPASLSKPSQAPQLAPSVSQSTPPPLLFGQIDPCLWVICRLRSAAVLSNFVRLLHFYIELVREHTC